MLSITNKHTTPANTPNHSLKTEAMWHNYLKIAFRNVLKHKATAAINIIGLSIGLASFILILMYVLDELSYDRYHQDADRIYRLVG